MDKSKDPVEIYDSPNILGKCLSLRGSVKVNDFNGNIEFIANEIEEPDKEALAQDIVKDIEKLDRIN